MLTRFRSWVAYLLDRTARRKDAPPAWSVYVRKGENKPLPLSSFLDPARLAQRHRRRLPKPDAPVYENLDEFRKKIADNPYARLLAQPVRTCKFTNTPLPKSLLLRFHVLKDPAPPHSLTYLPLSLYQSSRRRNEPSLDLSNSPLSSGLSFVLRAPVLAALQTIEYRRLKRDRRAGKSLPTIAPHTLTTVNHLFAQSIFSALWWPLRRRLQDFAALPFGLAKLKDVPDVAGVMFFGGRVRTQRLLDIEKQVIESASAIDHAIGVALSWYRSKNKVEPLGYGGLVKANPRVMYDRLRLSSVQYQDSRNRDRWRFVNAVTRLFSTGPHFVDQDPWRPAEYRVPVFAMVDMLGQDKATELLKGTQLEGSTWIAIKHGRHTAPALEWLIKGAFWFADSKP